MEICFDNSKSRYVRRVAVSSGSGGAEQLTFESEHCSSFLIIAVPLKIADAVKMENVREILTKNKDLIKGTFGNHAPEESVEIIHIKQQVFLVNGNRLSLPSGACKYIVLGCRGYCSKNEPLTVYLPEKITDCTAVKRSQVHYTVSREKKQTGFWKKREVDTGYSRVSFQNPIRDSEVFYTVTVGQKNYKIPLSAKLAESTFRVYTGGKDSEPIFRAVDSIDLIKR